MKTVYVVNGKKYQAKTGKGERLLFEAQRLSNLGLAVEAEQQLSLFQATEGWRCPSASARTAAEASL